MLRTPPACSTCLKERTTASQHGHSGYWSRPFRDRGTLYLGGQAKPGHLRARLLGTVGAAIADGPFVRALANYSYINSLSRGEPGYAAIGRVEKRPLSRGLTPGGSLTSAAAPPGSPQGSPYRGHLPGRRTKTRGGGVAATPLPKQQDIGNVTHTPHNGRTVQRPNLWGANTPSVSGVDPLSYLGQPRGNRAPTEVPFALLMIPSTLCLPGEGSRLESRFCVR
jgi:hypothetical protein